MRKLMASTAGLSLFCAAPAAAQVPVIMLVPGFQRPPAKCYDPELPQKADLVLDRKARAEVAIRKYLTLAAASTDLTPVFADKKYNVWMLDGAQQSIRNAQDPWAAKVAGIEMIGFAVSNLSAYDYQAAWRAFAGDGTTLGFYEAALKRNPEKFGPVFAMKLFSPTSPPPVVKRYCRYPNDIEDLSLRG